MRIHIYNILRMIRYRRDTKIILENAIVLHSYNANQKQNFSIIILMETRVTVLLFKNSIKL
jgi:hypothetical protein